VISFRYHVVSLVAVLLSLAAGVVLGGGPLSDLGRSDKAPAVTATDAGDARQEAAFADALATQGATRLYADGLEGSAVVLVSLPGASDTTRNALAEQVQAAGATVGGTYAIQPTLVDTGEKTLVDTLGSQLMTQLPDGVVSADADTYTRLGELLGVALTTTNTRGTKPLGDQSTGILSSLDGAGLLSSTGKASGRAAYVVVLLGDEPSSEGDAIYAGLLSGLAAHSAGVVVAGAESDGLLGRLRTEPVAAEVATVDGVAGGAGQVTAVLALTEWPSTKGGSFGASGADGAVGLR
jgi:hypothetical protein